jgi:hypothetical protein
LLIWMFQLAQLSWSGALIVRLVPNLKWCFPPVPRLHTASEPASEGNESLGTRQIIYGESRVRVVYSLSYIFPTHSLLRILSLPSPHLISHYLSFNSLSINSLHLSFHSSNWPHRMSFIFEERSLLLPLAKLMLDRTRL